MASLFLTHSVDGFFSGRLPYISWRVLELLQHGYKLSLSVSFYSFPLYCYRSIVQVQSCSTIYWVRNWAPSSASFLWWLIPFVWIPWFGDSDCWSNELRLEYSNPMKVIYEIKQLSRKYLWFWYIFGASSKIVPWVCLDQPKMGLTSFKEVTRARCCLLRFPFSSF